MSYILDALRRADAERERGAVPGLHAQPLNDDDGEGPAARPGSNPLVWVIVALGLVLLASLGWHMVGSDPAPAETLAAAPPEPARVAPVPAPAPVEAVAAPPVPAPPVTAQAPQATAPSFAPAPAPPQRATPEPPLDKPLPRPQRPEAAADRAARPASAPPAAPAVAPTAAAATAEPRIPSVAELPEDVRRGLPSLSFGGSVYSETPANRILIINGQVYNEGGRPAPDLVLEQIRLKSAVLRFRNVRYEVAY